MYDMVEKNYSHLLPLLKVLLTMMQEAVMFLLHYLRFLLDLIWFHNKLLKKMIRSQVFSQDMGGINFPLSPKWLKINLTRPVLFVPVTLLVPSQWVLLLGCCRRNRWHFVLIALYAHILRWQSTDIPWH